MIERLRDSNRKSFPLFTSIFLVATALSILLDIPVLRQVLGFVFFTFVPGFLILCLLKLNNIGLTEKLVLSVGLSISFLMFAGLFINTVFPFFGYDRPLSTNPLLTSFSVIILILAIATHLRNQDASFLNLSDFRLNTKEKAFLLIPAIFPLLSTLGMHIMNSTANNVMLMVLLFLIPAYIITTLLIYPPVVSYKGVENLEGGYDENGCWQPTIAGVG